MYVFIGEPKSCSNFITNGAKLRLSDKYIHIRSLIMINTVIARNVNGRTYLWGWWKGWIRLNRWWWLVDDLNRKVVLNILIIWYHLKERDYKIY